MTGYVVRIGDQEYHIEILDDRHIRLNGEIVEVDLATLADSPLLSLIVDGRSYEVLATPQGEEWEIHLKGRTYLAQVEDEVAHAIHKATSPGSTERSDYILQAPMPGLIVAIPVSKDQTVESNEVLVILESMKMQNELRAPHAGQVVEIYVQPGERVLQKQNLLRLRPI
ncbi:biotin/lipoyl-containing protein [Thermanaerothrix sp.]|jgi:pyruvate carboxylase subunit B|uniref:biotin/lipoyl-containing protein n=1 Tax=Thermanaerothrix sp. TaxID=2972675 RepID=UPI002ADDC054|nr:biotin/lipoyl-containing protein [Thermanaerothrix sp.]